MGDELTEQSTGATATEVPGDLSRYDVGQFEDGAAYSKALGTDSPLHPAVHGAAYMLWALGIVGDDKTPIRLVQALDELTAGRAIDPARHLAVRFPSVASVHELQRSLATEPTLVMVTDVPFASVCEHHMLPFTGVATVAYLPKAGGEIVGLSKLARLVQEYAARPQVQERLTYQVVAALMDTLKPLGAACAVRGVHSCMALRGARTGGHAAMVTVNRAGDLENAPWRDDFNAALNTAAWR